MLLLTLFFYAGFAFYIIKPAENFAENTAAKDRNTLALHLHKRLFQKREIAQDLLLKIHHKNLPKNHIPDNLLVNNVESIFVSPKINASFPLHDLVNTNSQQRQAPEIPNALFAKRNYAFFVPSQDGSLRFYEVLLAANNKNIDEKYLFTFFYRSNDLKQFLPFYGFSISAVALDQDMQLSFLQTSLPEKIKSKVKNHIAETLKSLLVSNPLPQHHRPLPTLIDEVAFSGERWLHIPIVLFFDKDIKHILIYSTVESQTTSLQSLQNIIFLVCLFIISICLLVGTLYLSRSKIST